ncbi:sugar-phosphatase [Thorsellia kenyensis]|uniref:Sugar-phosphatase n=1 Tax=Thorsellia kenyensis TaxID=1549888 RepID=A0ABV6C8S2_9GAMM
MSNPPKKIELIALDMDGTLLNSQHDISEYTIDVITKVRAKGIKVVLVTGRPYIGTVKFTEKLSMREDNDYVIVCNGSLTIKPKTGEVVTQETLDINDYYELEALSRELNVHFHVFDKDNVYTANKDISPYTILETQLTGIALKFRTPEEMPKEMQFPKMMMIDEPEVLNQAIAKLPPSLYERYNIIKSAPYFLEIIPKGVNKGLTLKKLAHKLGIPAEHILAMGDQGNDIAMFEFAGYSVAMGNAIDELKEIADGVAETNDNDGVGKTIEKFCL